MDLHSGPGTFPVRFSPDGFLLTLTLWRSRSRPEELPLRRALLRSLWLPDTAELPCSRDSRAPEGSALRGGEATPVRGPESSTCRAQDEAGAVAGLHQNWAWGALVSCGTLLQLCEGQISCCSGASSPHICCCCIRTSHLEL